GALDTDNVFRASTRSGLVTGSGGLTPEEAIAPLSFRDFALHPELPYHLSFSQGIQQSATMMQPVGGMDRIAYAFAEQLGAHLTLGAEVTAIRRSGTGVRIEG